MGEQSNAWPLYLDRQVLVKKTRSFVHLGEIWKKDWGETIAAQDQALQTKLSCDKNITKRNRQEMQTL